MTGGRPDGAALVALAEDLVRELRPGAARGAVTLDSALAADLGIDSLARVELLLRIEKAFGATVPDAAAQEAETLRDLLAALGTAVPAGAAPGGGPRDAAGGDPLAMPAEAQTLVGVLEWHAARHPGRVHITLVEEGDRHTDITYADLLREAGEVAAGLLARDLAPGEPVALMLQTCREYFQAFFGILMAGGIPVPLYPPAKATQIEEHVRRQAKILESTRAPLLVASEEARRPAGLVKSLTPTLRDVVTVADLRVRGAAPPGLHLHAEDVALLQYTSGSTGDPKGVTLTHANLLANIRAMQQACGLNGADTFVSWLPLYHDMGLIGAWLGSLYTGARAVLMSPLLFLSRPQRWLRTMSRERGTASAAPNFAYDLCATRLPDHDVAEFDLSAWRLAFNGAEAVHADSLERFAARFGPVGFRRGALLPVYGLAENGLGVTFPPLDRGPRVDRVRREEFLRARRAAPADAGDATALSFVVCGRPLPGVQVRIVDDAGQLCGPREHGRVQFRAASATRGYWRNPEATQRLFDGDWVETGDLGYLADGELVPAGRAKDLIIRGGRNIIPTEIEEAVSGVPGVRRGSVAVFGVHDPKTGTERVVVVAETALRGADERAALERAVAAAAAPLLDGPPDEVVLALPRTVPKTPSGKIRRSAAREIHEHGGFHRPPPGAARQLAGLLARSVLPGIARAALALARALYAAWAWCVFLALALPIWITVVPLPGLHARRALLRAWLRTLFRLLLMPVTTRDLDRLPATPCLLAPNHAGYLDSLLLAALLPSRFGFVVKRELARNPILAPLLRRLGAVFVERFDPRQSVQDTGGVADAVRAGGSFVIFPEGTFRRAAGLQAFRMGAFLVAAQTGVPVVPVGIRGTRTALRDKTWAPRWTALAVSAGAPIVPTGTDWGAAVGALKRCRAALVELSGELDAEPGSPEAT